MRRVFRATRAKTKSNGGGGVSIDSAYNRNYRQIEAMYHSDFSIEEIVKQMPHMRHIEVLDIIQTIFGKEQVRKERARTEAAQRYRQQNNYNYRNNSRGGRYDRYNY